MLYFGSEWLNACMCSSLAVSIGHRVSINACDRLAASDRRRFLLHAVAIAFDCVMLCARFVNVKLIYYRSVWPLRCATVGALHVV